MREARPHNARGLSRRLALCRIAASGDDVRWLRWPELVRAVWARCSAADGSVVSGTAWRKNERRPATRAGEPSAGFLAVAALARHLLNGGRWRFRDSAWLRLLAHPGAERACTHRGRAAGEHPARVRLGGGLG